MSRNSGSSYRTSSIASAASAASAASYSWPTRQKVAIVGSGSAGIAALWALNGTHHDVYLYEAGNALGGHTNTVGWYRGKYRTAVDAGFMVFNSVASPNFSQFLEKVRVKSTPCPGPLGVSRDDNGPFEWATSAFGSLLRQPGNLVSPRRWRTVYDMVRFNHLALRLLGTDVPPPLDPTIGQWLDDNGFSDGFRDDFLLPTMAALWSTSPGPGMLQFPVTTAARCLWNNGILGSVAEAGKPPPTWRALADGSRSYVDAVMHGFPPNHLFLGTFVERVRSAPGGHRVVLELDDGTTEEYDHVVLACHGDQAYGMIKDDCTPDEREILSSFQPTVDVAELHSDASVMPRRRKAWASWNVSTASSSSLTFNLNTLQSIPNATFGDVFLTLNPDPDPARGPDRATVQGQFSYVNVQPTPESVAAQARLGEIQNTRGISYAGAWTGDGLHEDGFSSGLAVARDHLGARLPFAYVDPTQAARGQRPRFGILDHVVGALLLVAQLVLAFVVAVGAVVEGKMALARDRAAGARVGVIEKKRVVRKAIARALSLSSGRQRQVRWPGRRHRRAGLANGAMADGGTANSTG